jgi:hypothetical protein
MALVVLACDRPVIVEWVGSATIYGRVIRSDSSAVAGVTLQTATGPAGACNGLTGDGIGGTALSDHIGNYYIVMGGFGVTGPYCVRVVATPPQGSGLGRDSATVPNLQMRREGGDSVHLDFLLRPAA